MQPQTMWGWGLANPVQGTPEPGWLTPNLEVSCSGGDHMVGGQGSGINPGWGLLMLEGGPVEEKLMNCVEENKERIYGKVI